MHVQGMCECDDLHRKGREEEYREEMKGGVRYVRWRDAHTEGRRGLER